MPDAKVSVFSVLSTFAGTEEIPVIDPANKRSTLNALREFFSAPPIFKVLTADATGQNVNTAQPWFPTAGAVSVEASTTYWFKGKLWSTRAAGTTSHTTGVSIGGTATITRATNFAGGKEGETAGFADFDMAVAGNLSNLQVKGASTSATENKLLTMEGIIVVNAAGTLIPQFTYSAAPGGAPTIKAGTFFAMWKMGGSSFASNGTWS